MIRKNVVMSVWLVMIFIGTLQGRGLEHNKTSVTGTAKQGVNEYAQVPTGQYEPQVLIEGEWGAGPDEFGMTQIWGVELVTYQPMSLAVNSRGEIYVLDIVNNRIKKYDHNGKYMKNLDVPSFLDKTKVPFKFDKDAPDEDKPYYRGINIGIDSKDRLYYCFIKGNMSELWRFENDEFRKKWDLPFIIDFNFGLQIEGNDNVLVFNRGRRYDVFKGTQKEIDNAFYAGENVIVKVDRSKNESSNMIKVTFIKGNDKSIIRELSYTNDKAKSVWVKPIIKAKNIFLAHGWDPNRTTFIDIYNEGGQFISSHQVPDGKIDLTHSAIDQEGNVYQIKEASDSEGLQIIKWAK